MDLLAQRVHGSISNPPLGAKDDVRTSGREIARPQVLDDGQDDLGHGEVGAPEVVVGR